MTFFLHREDSYVLIARLSLKIWAKNLNYCLFVFHLRLDQARSTLARFALAWPGLTQAWLVSRLCLSLRVNKGSVCQHQQQRSKQSRLKVDFIWENKSTNIPCWMLRRLNRLEIDDRLYCVFVARFESWLYLNDVFTLCVFSRMILWMLWL